MTRLTEFRDWFLNHPWHWLATHIWPWSTIRALRIESSSHLDYAKQADKFHAVCRSVLPVQQLSAIYVEYHRQGEIEYAQIGMAQRPNDPASVVLTPYVSKDSVAKDWETACPKQATMVPLSSEALAAFESMREQRAHPEQASEINSDLVKQSDLASSFTKQGLRNSVKKEDD